MKIIYVSLPATKHSKTRRLKVVTIHKLYVFGRKFPDWMKIVFDF